MFGRGRRGRGLQEGEDLGEVDVVDEGLGEVDGLGGGIGRGEAELGVVLLHEGADFGRDDKLDHRDGW